jgi:hypothetical protein
MMPGQVPNDRLRSSRFEPPVTGRGRLLPMTTLLPVSTPSGQSRAAAIVRAICDQAAAELRRGSP